MSKLFALNILIIAFFAVIVGYSDAQLVGDSIYVWAAERADTAQKQQDLVDVCYDPGNILIKNIYYSCRLGVGTLYPDNELHSLNSLVHNSSPASISALFGPGDPAAEINEVITQLIPAVLTYNSNCSNDAQKFDAIHLDYEFTGTPTSTHIQNYADAKTACGSLPLYVDIRHWWDNDVTYNTVTKKAYEHILDIVDGVCVMAYDDDSADIVSRATDEVSYANTIGKAVHVSVETNSGVADDETFYEEGESQMKTALQNVTFGSNSFDGFAYHHYKYFYSAGTANWPNHVDGTLSVSLASFTAKSDDDSIILHWRTETEIDNVGFAIYRSIIKDGEHTKIGFAVGDYDPNFTLILDPGYSTYLGGSAHDEGLAIDVDALGNAYVTGFTRFSDFPTQNPFQSSYGGGTQDAFVTKLSSNGTLTYSTYLGGSNFDEGYDIAADSSGNAYVAGFTDSSDFPTQNPYDDSLGGTRDAFVTKLNVSGNMLVYSTYLGGSSGDACLGIDVDSSGNAYVTGATNSSDFPTLSPYQGIYSGGQSDTFVTKLSSSGNTLIYSTYLGGSGFDESYGITVDGSGNAYVTGFTYSSDFPTLSPFQSIHNGGREVFVTKLSSGGNTLIYSTYLGGSGNDVGTSITVDINGEVYVVGATNSPDFPTQNPYQGSYSGGTWDAFVTKLSSGGNTLIYSTYLGGSSDDSGYDIALDSAGNVYLTGYTYSSDFPTQNPYQSIYTNNGHHRLCS